MFLSMPAAIQAPIILMAQNRQAEKNRLNAEHDYEVNLKSELEANPLNTLSECNKASTDLPTDTNYFRRILC